MKKTKIATDITIGVAVGVVVMGILKQSGIEMDASLGPAIGAFVVALLARFGIALREKDKGE